MHKQAKATLGSGNLQTAVKLPEREDLNEWLAVNSKKKKFQTKKKLTIIFFLKTAVDFFNQINLLYGSITEFCTEEFCPVMSAGPKFEYHWADGVQVTKPIKVSAPKYVDYLMTWVQGMLDNEKIFPSRIGKF